MGKLSQAGHSVCMQFILPLLLETPLISKMTWVNIFPPHPSVKLFHTLQHRFSCHSWCPFLGSPNILSFFQFPNIKVHSSYCKVLQVLTHAQVSFIFHYSITQNSFTTLKKNPLSFIHSTFSQAFSNHWSF